MSCRFVWKFGLKSNAFRFWAGSAIKGSFPFQKFSKSSIEGTRFVKSISLNGASNIFQRRLQSNWLYFRGKNLHLDKLNPWERLNRHHALLWVLLVHFVMLEFAQKLEKAWTHFFSWFFWKFRLKLDLLIHASISLHFNWWLRFYLVDFCFIGKNHCNSYNKINENSHFLWIISFVDAFYIF